MNCVTALKREEKGKKARQCGFIPGTIYGSKLDKSFSVKFNKSEIMQVIKTDGDNAKLMVMLEEQKKYAVIKNIQRNPIMKDDIYNIDIQVITMDEEIKQYVPIIFEGKNFIESKGLSLQTILSEIEVMAKAVDIPKMFVLDVSDKDSGDVIRVKDIEENGNFEIISDPEGTVASISYPKIKQQIEEE